MAAKTTKAPDVEPEPELNEPDEGVTTVAAEPEPEPEPETPGTHTLVLSNGDTVQTNVPVATHHYDRHGVKRAVVRRLVN